MALNAWQLLTRVLPGQPFGDGADGAYSSATIPTMTRDSCSGTATSTTLTTSGSTFANGDILKVIQMRGTGVGQWEIVKVSSGGGSTSLTLSTALQYTYTDSGASQAQAIKIPRYTSVTVQSGTWDVPSWNQNTGGGLVFACNGTSTVTGNIVANGNSASGGTPGQGDGFYGGQETHTGDNTDGNQGEGSGGAGTTSNAANGNGGGGGGKDATFAASGSGGGGNGTAGTAGGTTSTPGSGGATAGHAELTTMVMGGGGGGGAGSNTGSAAGSGGAGGGIISIFSKDITLSGSLTSNGGNGANAVSISNGGGGGGAGGSILICGYTVALGTDKFSLVGGTGGAGSGGSANSGAGGKGRIAVYYGSSLSGSISASLYGTYTNAQDTSLIETSSSFFLMF